MLGKGRDILSVA